MNRNTMLNENYENWLHRWLIMISLPQFVFLSDDSFPLIETMLKSLMHSHNFCPSAVEQYKLHKTMTNFAHSNTIY